MTDSDRPEPTAARDLIGSFATRLVELTDGTLYGEVWNRGILSRRERSLITIAALVAAGNFEQLPWHLRYAVENGVSEQEIAEEITHLAFYASWPKAMSAITAAKLVFEDSFPRQELG